MHQTSSTRFRRAAVDANGWTILEVLLVCMVLALLLALVVPAVHAARETSRRISCQNNLRQLILGVSHYESVYGAFPPFGEGGVYVKILPFTELDSIDIVEQPATPTPKLFRCPSDFAMSQTQYAVSYVLNSTSSPDSKLAGMAGIGIPGGMLRLEDVVDGTLSTAYLSEAVPSYTPGSVSEAFAVPGGASFEINTTGPVSYAPADYEVWRQDFIGGCLNGPWDPIIDTGARRIEDGDFWYQESSRKLYDHTFPPNWKIYLQARDHGSPFAMFGKPAQSRHSGGVLVAFVDGHLRFVSNNIDGRVWYALGTRNGNEAVTDF
jgi:prepilin-type processing-associated H-X9-DG protein